MKKKLLILFNVIVLFGTLQSQDIDSVEVYSGGQIVRNLPYARPFKIVGEAHTRMGIEADLIQVSITLGKKEDGGRCKDCDDDDDDCSYTSAAYASNYWVRKTGSNDKRFGIIMSRPLKFAHCYKVKIDYYKRASLSEGEVGELIEEIISSYMSTDPSFVGIQDLNDTLLKKIGTELSNKLQAEVDNNPEIGILKLSTNSVKTIDESSLPAKYKNPNQVGSLAFNIANSILVLGVIEYYENQIDTVKNKLSTYVQTQNENLDLLFGELSQIQAAQPSAILDQEIKSIYSFAIEGEMPVKNPFANHSKVRQAISDANLKKVYNRLYLAYQTMSSLANAKSVFEERLDSYNNEIDSQKTAINNAYLLVDRSLTNQSASVNSATELEKTRFSAPVGFGGSLFNPFEDSREFNGLGYLGLRYYFSPVDKGILGSPYLDGNRPWNRMSAVVGFLVGSNYDYRGQDINNALLGVKPVLAIGYDLTFFLTLDVGTISFNQSRIHPFNNSEKWVFAPYLGVSLELDVLNRVGSVLTRKNYTIGSN